MNSNLRTGDNVMVISGKDKGKTGKIIASDTEKGRVTVNGVNIVYKHSKPRSQKDKGGIKKSEAAIDASNVLIVCPSCGKATRIAHKTDEKNKKHRACKKCGAFMDGEKRAKAKKETKKTEEKVKVEKDNKVNKNPKIDNDKKEISPKNVKQNTTTRKISSTTKRKAPVAKSTGK